MPKLLTVLKTGLRRSYFFVHQLYFTLAGNAVSCNICKFKANKLNSDSWHLYTICPRCQSGVRQRLLWEALCSLEEVNLRNLITDKKVLHFAPEHILRDLIRKTASLYKTADFFAGDYTYPNIDYNLDISAMPKITDSSYDCLIACDVLEHVQDHHSAFMEINRVLKPGGYCILTVPQKDGLQVTLEDLSITDPAEREKAFGQSDHLRIYGADFAKMLDHSGFDVFTVNEQSFPAETVRRFVLFPPVLSEQPMATNHRTIYFGKKR